MTRAGPRPLDEYEPEEDGTVSPYGSYYVVLPEGSWESSPSMKDSDEPVVKAPPNGFGVVAALVAGTVPALLVDLPAALVAGVVAGVFGGLAGRALGAEWHDRGRRRAGG